jgi:cytochrome oxidase Cu insertion factor (SCO1/SenC/PrrC family)
MKYPNLRLICAVTLACVALAAASRAASPTIGKVAPDIEGVDVDGKKFKLSDYRGKVVVLDFWGDW